MDRDEVLRGLLKRGPEGVAEWNRRRQEGEEIPDLVGVRLDRARLDGARLSGVSLVGARLVGARLDGVGLDRARLDGARLDGASLVSASLVSASLVGASLVGASLDGATCRGTVFADVDLSEVEGLESVQHLGPSHISTDTLFRSKGRIPKVFLQGCGVPDILITYLPDLISALEPIQFHSCFISYSTKDEEFAKRIHLRMRDKRLQVWFAPEDMKAGHYHDEQIERAIQVHDKLLLVLSESSMASTWVRREIREARQTEEREARRKLFPIRLVSMEAIQGWQCVDPRTGQDYAEEVLRYHIPDFSRWKDHDTFEAAFARLLRDLKAEDSTAILSGLESSMSSRLGPT
ncbi:MAG: toll/interleukin-1 receptor domain-containing protein [Planctomycetaceae bacterium]|nr:toll/interleukin-1 receptor domain-containing protein [Planctomycetaceae bacterium]